MESEIKKGQFQKMIDYVKKCDEAQLSKIIAEIKKLRERRRNLLQGKIEFE